VRLLPGNIHLKGMITTFFDYVRLAADFQRAHVESAPGTSAELAHSVLGAIDDLEANLDGLRVRALKDGLQALTADERTGVAHWSMTDTPAPRPGVSRSSANMRTSTPSMSVPERSCGVSGTRHSCIAPIRVRIYPLICATVSARQSETVTAPHRRLAARRRHRVVVCRS
jgi:hypothetical protein